MAKKDEEKQEQEKVYVDRIEAGDNISWSAILAGVVTFIAMLLTLSLVGSAIGLDKIDPTAIHPFEEVGTGLLIWTVVSFVISLGAAGFVAGYTASRSGFVHGFLTWATGVIALMAVMSFITVSAFSAIGSTVGNAFAFAGESVKTVATGSGELVAEGFDRIVGDVNKIDTDKLEAQTIEILEDTNIPELQPEYINSKLQEASREIATAGKEILLNPDSSEKILDATITSLQLKAETIAGAIDKEAIANAVNENTDLTQEESEEAIENIYVTLTEMSAEAEAELEIVSERINQAQVELEQIVEEAKVQADKISDATAKASIWGFISLVIGLIVTSFAGMFAAKAARNKEVKV